MNHIFAEKLRCIRKKNGLTQKDLARYVGLTEQTIVRLESGNYYPSMATLSKLETFFGRVLWQRQPSGQIEPSNISHDNISFLDWLLSVDKEVLLRVEMLCRIAGLYSKD